jgi:hypothetical protein
METPGFRGDGDPGAVFGKSKINTTPATVNKQAYPRQRPRRLTGPFWIFAGRPRRRIAAWYVRAIDGAP